MREVNQIDELASYRDDWGRLLDQTAGGSFFHSLDWLTAYWRHNAGDQRLRVLIVEEMGRPSGILPLVVRRDRTGVGVLRVLTYPLDHWGSFFGPIGPNPAATLAAGLEHLRRTPRDWDVIELRWQGAPEAALGPTAHALRAAGYQTQITPMRPTALVEMSGAWDDYLAIRPRAWRRNLRAAERALTAKTAAEHVRYRPAGRAHGESDPRWDLYEACEEIARRSWQARALRGTTLADERVRGFLRDAHLAAAAVGAVDMSLLYVDSRPAAYMYSYVWRGALYGLRSGFDPEFARYSIGNVLMARTLADSWQRGDRLFDLGVGSLETKRLWQSRLANIYRLCHFHPTVLRAQLLRVRRWWEGCRASPDAEAQPVFTAVGCDQDGAADAR